MKRRHGLSHTTARTFVIRFVVDDTGNSTTTLRGQMSEPTCEEGWVATFANTDECWRLLQARLRISTKRHRHPGAR